MNGNSKAVGLLGTSFFYSSWAYLRFEFRSKVRASTWKPQEVLILSASGEDQAEFQV